MDTLSRFSLPAILLILTLAFGFWLSSAGKPYNGILFNLHKLIALGGVIYTGWQFLQWMKTADASLALTILLAVTALCVIALFASGGLLSAAKLDYALMLLIHRLGVGTLVLSLGSVLYLLGKTV